MTICINDNLWDEEERSEIIKAAVNIPQKKRIRKQETKIKKKMLVEFTIVESESEEESKSKNENGFSFSEGSEGLF